MLKQKIIFILNSLGIFLIVQQVYLFLFSKRTRLAKKYIKGKGIEVGALDAPLKVSRNTRILYVDRLTKTGLRKHYPELEKKKIVNIGVVDDGEKLSKIKSSSLDFVVANHFIEHCEDPILTLENHLRVLKSGGLIFWAIPNKLYTFDKNRPVTTNEHLWLDHINGGKFSRLKHYNEYVRLALGDNGEEARIKTKRLLKEKYSIHFHVWTPEKFRSFLDFTKKKMRLSFRVLEMVINLKEVIFILRKD